MQELYEKEYQRILDKAVKRMCKGGHIFEGELYEIMKQGLINKYINEFKYKIGSNWEQFIYNFINNINEVNNVKDDVNEDINQKKIYNLDMLAIRENYQDIYSTIDELYNEYFFNESMFKILICPEKFYKTIDTVHRNTSYIWNEYANDLFKLRFKYTLSYLSTSKIYYFNKIPKDINQIIFNLL